MSTNQPSAVCQQCVWFSPSLHPHVRCSRDVGASRDDEIFNGTLSARRRAVGSERHVSFTCDGVRQTVAAVTPSTVTFTAAASEFNCWTDRRDKKTLQQQNIMFSRVTENRTTFSWNDFTKLKHSRNHTVNSRRRMRRMMKRRRGRAGGGGGREGGAGGGGGHTGVLLTRLGPGIIRLIRPIQVSACDHLHEHLFLPNKS